MHGESIAAEQLEAEAKAWTAALKPSCTVITAGRQATTALQIAIAMAAILLLNRRHWLQYAIFGLAGLGSLLGLMALLQF